MIGDFERLSDHSVNITESVRELNDKNISFSGQAENELKLLVSAVKEIITITKTAFFIKYSVVAYFYNTLKVYNHFITT